MLRKFFDQCKSLPPSISQSTHPTRRWIVNHIPFQQKKASPIHATAQSLNDDLAATGFAYEPRQDIFYSLMDPWQRDFGYCRLYDEAAAPLSMVIDSEPIRFEYANKKWLIELWKGQYGMTTGGEIGVYTSSGLELDIPGIFTGTFYESATNEELLPITFTLRKNQEILFTRSARHWWLTGFKLGLFSEPEELTMEISIELKDQAMTQAFVQALKQLGYLSFHLDIRGNMVRFDYIQPYSKQPDSRSGPVEWLAQQNNQQFCDAFELITRGYDRTLDKLLYVKDTAPDLYQQILHIGKSERLFESFDILKKFIN